MIIPLVLENKKFESEFLKFFERNKRTFMRLHGFCVARIDDEVKIIGYRHTDGFETYFSDGLTEYPQLYKTVWGIKRFLAKNPDWIQAYWISDAIHFEPLTKYVNLKHRFPGCPRK